MYLWQRSHLVPGHGARVGYSLGTSVSNCYECESSDLMRDVKSGTNGDFVVAA